MEAALSNDNKLRTLRMPVELVSLTRVQKTYGGGGPAWVRALDDIHLRMNSGEIVVVCGPCGCGKTSLLNIVGMLEAASEGSVVIASLLVSKLSEQARADLRGDMIGFVFQSFSLIPVLSARENVLLPLLLRGTLEHAELAAAQARADSLLSQLGLATQAGHYPPRLDASQSQRVAIARALIAKPRLVIADEPTSRLDTSSIRIVMDLFKREQEEQGTAFLISTRDQRQISGATRTLQMLDGRLDNTPKTGKVRRPLRVEL